MTKTKRHQALRRGRASIAGQIYLVTTTTSQRQPRFVDWIPASAAAQAIHAESARAGVDLLCWVLMPDHWHGLVALREGCSLSGVMNRLKSCSAVAVNRACGTHGSVWSRAFHDHALRRDEDLIDVARYVVANPLRAGLVRRLADYPFWNAIWL